MPAKKRKQPDERYPLKLTVKQWESLVHSTRLAMGLKTRIKEASRDRQFVEFTKKELEKMGEEIYTSLAYVPPAHRKRLNAALDKIDDLLDDLEGKHLMEKRQAVHKSGAIYQFKVTLKESDPPIWRRIQVPDCTLGELHEVLQVVMGWEDCHLHQFIVRGEYYGPLDPEDREWHMEKGDEEGIPISQVAKTGRKVRFIYEYDFGDSWQHEIALEKRLEPEPKVKYPRCLEGARACPPEDCGGAWGYADFLEAMADPKHENHRDMKEWIGGKFDPEKFDLNAVNRELRTV
ncbi:MAG: plasmid pRiA4b ORF-3 family protein [Isosphaeraceae bacterium]|jgi:hypothetical protein